MEPRQWWWWWWCILVGTRGLRGIGAAVVFGAVAAALSTAHRDRHTMRDHPMKLRLRRVGNSLGVILPKAALQALGVESREGEKLILVRLRDGSG